MAKGGKISPETEFKKGQSGNPNGRPKKLPEIDKLMAEVMGEEKDDMYFVDLEAGRDWIKRERDLTKVNQLRLNVLNNL